MAQIRNRFKILLAQKELRDERMYTYEDINKATGISPTTLSSYARGKVTRFDESTLVALCTWLECDLAELIEFPPAQSQQSTEPRRSMTVSAAIG